MHAEIKYFLATLHGRSKSHHCACHNHGPQNSSLISQHLRICRNTQKHQSMASRMVNINGQSRTCDQQKLAPTIENVLSNKSVVRVTTHNIKRIIYFISSKLIFCECVHFFQLLCNQDVSMGLNY